MQKWYDTQRALIIVNAYPTTATEKNFHRQRLEAETELQDTAVIPHSVGEERKPILGVWGLGAQLSCARQSVGIAETASYAFLVSSVYRMNHF